MLKLGGKLILAVLLALGTILSLGFYFVMERQSAELMAEVRESASSLSQIVSQGVSEHVWLIQYQYGYLQALTTQLSRLASVEYIEVFDREHIAIARTGGDWLGLHASGDQNMLIQQVLDEKIELVSSYHTVAKQRHYLPVFAAGKSQEVIAVVVVAMSDTAAAEHDNGSGSVVDVVRDSLAQVLRQVTDKKQSLKNLVEQIRQIRDVSLLEVYNEQVMLLSSESLPELEQGAELSASIKRVYRDGEVIALERQRQGYYLQLSPVISYVQPGQVVGVVRLVMDLKPALAKTEALAQTMRLIAAAVAVAIFFVLSWVLQRLVIEPVRVLSDSARRIAKGDFHKVPALSSRDEVAELGAAFNSMIEDLAVYQEQLIKAKEYNDNILRTMGDALFIVSLDGRIEQINDATLKLLQYPKQADLVGMPVNLICSDQPRHSDKPALFWRDGSEYADKERYLITRNGSYVPVLFSFSYFHDINGNPVGAVCVARDITERKKAEQALLLAHDELEQRVKDRTEELFKEKEQLQVTLNSIGDAVITLDQQGTVEYLNPVAEKITGWSSDEALGHPLEEVMPLFDESGDLHRENPLEVCLLEGQSMNLSDYFTLHRQQHHPVAIEGTTSPIRDKNGAIQGGVIVFRDVSEELKLRNQLIHQASHDALTGLANRHVFECRLETALQQARHGHREHAVLFLDLDQFKVVNDTCGHVAGDALLQQLTSLLREKMRATDVLARLGGDEFGVILNSCSLEQAKKIAQILLDTVREFRFVWESKSFELGVSIGLVMVDHSSESVSSIMSAADVACYAAKDGGRNRYHIYEATDEELRQRHGEMQWVTLISQALEEDRFALYLQRIQALRSLGQASDHYEVLIRMLDEKGGVVPPGAFLPAAERYGLMGNIDRWVIRQTFRLLDELRRQGGLDSESLYAINLSGLSIGDETLRGYINEQFAVYRISPQNICFEITETVAVSNLTLASQFIKEMQALGCKFALDDFGSGVSSFSYLKNLPVDFLKIDGLFVRDMADDTIDYAMVEAINRIGQVMGIKTIAEFVENEAVLNCLVALKVDFAQGFHLDRPHPMTSANADTGGNRNSNAAPGESAG